MPGTGKDLEVPAINIPAAPVAETPEVKAPAMTAEALASLEEHKARLDAAFKAEREAFIAETKAQNDGLAKQIEELRMAQMKDDERKRYEEEKRIKAESDEKLALADRNTTLQNELEEIRTKQYINDSVSKYSFIEPKYRERLNKMNKSDFDKFFTEDFIQDQRELHEFRNRDKNFGNRNAFGGFPTSKGEPKDQISEARNAMEKHKEEYLKKILGNR